MYKFKKKKGSHKISKTKSLPHRINITPVLYRMLEYPPICQKIGVKPILSFQFIIIILKLGLLPGPKKREGMEG